MTYPRFRGLLEDARQPGRVVAIAARAGGEAVGLALGQIGPGPQLGRVLSLFVREEERRGGIGGELFARIEDELERRGCLRIEARYPGSPGAGEAVERILERRGWDRPLPSMLVCRADERILAAPWMRLRPLRELSVFPWAELTDRERAELRPGPGRPPWYPPTLGPEHPEPFDPETSLGLRSGRAVAGWALTHRLDAETVRYSRLFVREELQSSGRGIALLAEAIRRQHAARIPFGTFAVRMTNTPMVHFVRHRMAPYLTEVTETRLASKEIATR